MEKVSRRKFWQISGAVLAASTIPALALAEQPQETEKETYEILKVRLSKTKKEYSKMGVSIISWEEPNKTVSFIRHEATIASVMMANNVTREDLIKAVMLVYKINKAEAEQKVDGVLKTLDDKGLLMKLPMSQKTEFLKITKF